MKTLLTAEESAKLIELGASPKRASKRTFDPKDVNNLSKPIERRELLPAFTLGDILDILPKEINRERIEIGYDCDGWYGEYNYLTLPGSYSFAPELIDALYSLLVWCLEKGYIKTE